MGLLGQNPFSNVHLCKHLLFQGKERMLYNNSNTQNIKQLFLLQHQFSMTKCKNYWVWILYFPYGIINSLTVNSCIVIRQQHNNQPNITIYYNEYFCLCIKSSGFFWASESMLQKLHCECCVSLRSFQHQWRSRKVSCRLGHKIYHIFYFYWPRNKGIAVTYYRKGLPSPVFLSCQWGETYSDTKHKNILKKTIFFPPRQLNLAFLFPDIIPDFLILS